MTESTQPADKMLRQLRLDRGLSLRQVARASGINGGRLSIIERGVDPTPDELRRIMAALYPQAPAIP